MLADAALRVLQVGQREYREAIRKFDISKAQYYQLAREQTAAYEALNSAYKACIEPNKMLDAAERRTKRTLETYLLVLQPDAKAAPAPAERDSDGRRAKRTRAGHALTTEVPSASGTTRTAPVMGDTGAAGEVRARTVVVNQAQNWRCWTPPKHIP